MIFRNCLLWWPSHIRLKTFNEKDEKFYHIKDLWWEESKFLSAKRSLMRWIKSFISWKMRGIRNEKKWASLGSAAAAATLPPIFQWIPTFATSWLLLCTLYLSLYLCCVCLCICLFLCLCLFAATSLSGNFVSFANLSVKKRKVCGFHELSWLLLKGSFTTFLFSVRTHILNSYGVWYSWFWSEGPKNALNPKFLGFYFGAASRGPSGQNKNPKIWNLGRF